MPVGVCIDCGRDYYLCGVPTVEAYCCDQCGRPLVSIESLAASEPEPPIPPSAGPSGEKEGGP